MNSMTSISLLVLMLLVKGLKNVILILTIIMLFALITLGLIQVHVSTYDENLKIKFKLLNSIKKKKILNRNFDRIH